MLYCAIKLKQRDSATKKEKSCCTRDTAQNSTIKLRNKETFSMKKSRKQRDLTQSKPKHASAALKLKTA